MENIKNYKGKYLTLLQVVGPSFFYGAVYKGIIRDIRYTLPVPNFLNMINPFQPVEYSFPSPFPRVRFKKWFSG